MNGSEKQTENLDGINSKAKTYYKFLANDPRTMIFRAGSKVWVALMPSKYPTSIRNLYVAVALNGEIRVSNIVTHKHQVPPEFVPLFAKRKATHIEIRDAKTTDLGEAFRVGEQVREEWGISPRSKEVVA